MFYTKEERQSLGREYRKKLKELNLSLPWRFYFDASGAPRAEVVSAATFVVSYSPHEGWAWYHDGSPQSITLCQECNIVHRGLPKALVWVKKT